MEPSPGFQRWGCEQQHLISLRLVQEPILKDLNPASYICMLWLKVDQSAKTRIMKSSKTSYYSSPSIIFDRIFKEVCGLIKKLISQASRLE